MPDEAIYADDYDQITASTERDTKFANIAKEILAEDNLKVNESKTEFTTMKREKKSDEKWRETKKLGSLLGDNEDIANRKHLAIAAMKSHNDIWTRKTKVKKKLRISLYKSMVKSVLTYNSGT